MKTVDIIASGYEWECPKCKLLNKEIQWKEKVVCKKCGKIYEASSPEHAF